MLSNPANVPPRYRAELLRMMATFVDSALAGVAGFADIINDAPGIEARVAAARIVLEKTEHAGRVMEVMAGFGADTQKYATHQPWTARLARDADIGAARAGGDMRLSVFHYPLEGWTDAVVMNTLMGRATVIQLTELTRISYQPLAEAFRAVLPAETRHAELAEDGLRQLLTDPANRDAAAASVSYWWPRVEASFGLVESPRFEALKGLGLRHRSNAELLAEWREGAGALMAELGLPTG